MVSSISLALVGALERKMAFLQNHGLYLNLSGRGQVFRIAEEECDHELRIIIRPIEAPQFIV